MTNDEMLTSIKTTLEDLCQWFDEGGWVDGVHYDNASMLDAVTVALIQVRRLQGEEK